jgi:hypothetical protein
MWAAAGWRTLRGAPRRATAFLAIAVVLGAIALVGCSNTNPVRPDSTTGALSPGDIPSQVFTTAARSGGPSPDAGFGFNGVVSGFPTGKVFLSGGGTFDLATGFAKSSGGFRIRLVIGERAGALGAIVYA